MVYFSRIRYRIVRLFLLIFVLLAPNYSLSEDFEFLTWVTGDSVGDEFYKIARGSGDMNADGYQDVLIGAPYGGERGYVKVFYGGADFDTIPDLVMHGEIPNGGPYGRYCAFAGDVNDDGYDDILVGDTGADQAYMDCGKAYLYLGSVNPDTIADLTFRGNGSYQHMGTVSPAGDVNADGYDDWLIGEMNLWPQGFIYLYLGGLEPDSIPDVTFAKSYINTLQFDFPMLGDINGDYYDDIIIFNPDDVVEIHLGEAQMDNVPDLQWCGPPSIDICCGVGDVNDDGYNDWLIDLSWDRLLLYFGSAQPDTIPDIIINPESPFDGFCGQVAGSDIDGDGVNDIVIGGQDYVSTGSGSIIGYLGGTDFDSHFDYYYNSGIEYEILGYTIGMSDIDGDGIFEVLAGASQEYPGGAGAWGPGRVWFFTVPEAVALPPRQTAPYQGLVFTLGPNPFNPSTVLSFELRVASWVKLEVFDVLGRRMSMSGSGTTPTTGLVEGWLEAGRHAVTFDGSHLPSGVYWARLQAGEARQVRKMVLVK